MVGVEFVSIICRKKYTTLARTFSYYDPPRIIRIHNAKQDWSHWETVTCIFFFFRWNQMINSRHHFVFQVLQHTLFDFQ